RGRAYRDRTTPARWLSLSDSIDRHRVEPEAITAPVTLVGFTTDRLCPIEDMRELADRLPNLWRFEQHASVYGHDAFLEEDALVADILTSVLKHIDQCAAPVPPIPAPSPPARASIRTRPTARSCRRCICRPTIRSPPSASRANTTIHALAIRPATSWPRPWPSWKAAPAPWSPPPAWRRSTCRSACWSPATC